MTSVEYQLCQKLVLDTTYPGIEFDNKGVSNFVNYFDEIVKPNWKNNSNGLEELSSIVEEIKRKGKNKEFDCILGLSGGADSSYMLHLLVKNFNLRPLVFHVDGGWNSELAVDNIEKLVSGLSLDLFTEVINWKEMKDFQLSMFKSGVPHLDIPQDLAFVGVLYKFAQKHNIKYIFNGGNIATECIPRPLDLIYYGTDMRHIRDILRKFGSVKMENYPFTSIFYHKLYLRYLKGIRVIKPLNYIDYNKENAMMELESTYGWRPYPQKHFESRFTKFFEGYWLRERFNFDMRRVDLSSLILTDQLSRDEALKILDTNAYESESLAADFKFISSKLEISEDELLNFQTMPRKSYRDYRNMKPLLSYGEKIFSLVARTQRGGAY
ncbi:N-acetyl sugar amidotransferase [Paracoccaceae bacterium]|nr:N-acetyl sugar amidotransferase [Paracoccaceae bacterium]